MFNTLPEFILKSTTAKQKLDSVIYRELDSSSGTFVNKWKDVYEYNSNLLTTVFWEYWWKTDLTVWDLNVRTVVEHNATGSPITMTIYYMDDELGLLIPDYRMTAQYNSTGKLEMVKHYSPGENNTWILEADMVYFYRPDNLPEKVVLTVFMEEDGEAYTYTLTIVYTYNASGKMTSNISTMEMEGEEIIVSRTDYTWNTSGKLASQETLSFNYGTFALEKSDRTEFQYNTAGDASVNISSIWNSEGSTWQTDSKTEFTYNATDASEVVFPSMLISYNEASEVYVYPHSKALATIITFEMTEGSWLNTGRNVFYYSALVINLIQERSLQDITIYPNPFMEHVTFTWTAKYDYLDLDIFQITGSRVLSKVLYPGMTIPTNYLNPGVYLYRLMNNGEAVYTGKLIRR